MPVSLPLCFKCKKDKGRCVSRDGPSLLYCADCFSRYCVKSFTDAITHACELPCDEPVAVAVSGGSHSLFLLYQLGVMRARYGLRQKGGAMRFVLLPFLLREDALVLPPEAPTAAAASPSCATVASSPSAEGVEAPPRTNSAIPSPVQRAREAMRAQFDLLEAQTKAQIAEWTFAGERLFEPDELRVFSYSDFISTVDASNGRPSLEILRAVVHHPQLSLSQREALYETIKRRVLHLAAARVARQWRAQERHREGAEKKNEEEKKAVTEPAQPTQEGAPRKRLLGAECEVAAPSPAVHGETLHHRAGESGPSPWTFLVTGEGAELCAVRALESIVSGRGGDGMSSASGPRAYSLPFGTVNLRPLRGLLNKEVVLFLRLQKVTWSYTPSLSTGTSLRSTRRVLESFVLGLLQSGYRTSVFNILQTAAKLTMRPVSVGEVNTPALYDARRKAEKEQESKGRTKGKENEEEEGAKNPANLGDVTEIAGKPLRKDEAEATGEQRGQQRRRLETGKAAAASARITPSNATPQQQQQRGKKNSGGPMALNSRERNATWSPPRLTSSSPPHLRATNFSHTPLSTATPFTSPPIITAEGSEVAAMPGMSSAESETSTDAVPVCFLCGVPGCPTTSQALSPPPSSSTEAASMVELYSLDVASALWFETGSQCLVDGSKGGAVQPAFTLVCHGCSCLLADICPSVGCRKDARDGASVNATASAATPSPSPPSADSSETLPDLLLRTLFAFSRDSERLELGSDVDSFPDDNGPTRLCGAWGTAKKGELSAEDRAAYLLPDADDT